MLVSSLAEAYEFQHCHLLGPLVPVDRSEVEAAGCHRQHWEPIPQWTRELPKVVQLALNSILRRPCWSLSWSSPILEQVPQRRGHRLPPISVVERGQIMERSWKRSWFLLCIFQYISSCCCSFRFSIWGKHFLNTHKFYFGFVFQKCICCVNFIIIIIHVRVCFGRWCD